MLNSALASDLPISAFAFDDTKPIVVRIGNKADAEFVGGFNLFGKRMDVLR